MPMIQIDTAELTRIIRDAVRSAMSAANDIAEKLPPPGSYIARRQHALERANSTKARKSLRRSKNNE